MRDALDWSQYLGKVQQCWEGSLDGRVGDTGYTVTEWQNSRRTEEEAGKQEERPWAKGL